MHTVFWWGEQRERDHFEDLGLDGRITRKLIFKKRDRFHGLDRSGSI